MRSFLKLYTRARAVDTGKKPLEQGCSALAISPIAAAALNTLFVCFYLTRSVAASREQDDLLTYICSSPFDSVDATKMRRGLMRGREFGKYDMPHDRGVFLDSLCVL